MFILFLFMIYFINVDKYVHPVIFEIKHMQHLMIYAFIYLINYFVNYLFIKYIFLPTHSLNTFFFGNIVFTIRDKF